MDFMDLAKSRYSCRHYADKPVEDEKLQQVLEAGRLAPTAKNNQPQRIYVVQSKEALERLNEATPMLRDAPIGLVVGYSKGEASVIAMDSFYDGQYCAGTQDASIVATSMMYEAAELGLGSLWIRGYDTGKVRDALDLPDSFEMVMILALGYPGERGVPSPMHASRKPLDDTVMYL